MRLIDADVLKEAVDNGWKPDMMVSELWEIIDEAPTIGGWISVKDRLPELGEPYFAACRSLRDDREPWVIEGVYNLVTHDKPWGVPLVAMGEAEVYAWMPKVYPEPPEEDKE